MPSMRVAASSTTASALEDECETDVYSLQSQLIGTNVRGPAKRRYAPVVDLASVRSPAKLASANRSSVQSVIGSPTQQVCTQSLVCSIQHMNDEASCRMQPSIW